MIFVTFGRRPARNNTTAAKTISGSTPNGIMVSGRVSARYQAAATMLGNQPVSAVEQT